MRCLLTHVSFSKYSVKISDVLDQCHSESSFPPFFLKKIIILNPGMMDECKEGGRGKWAHDSMREAAMQL